MRHQWAVGELFIDNYRIFGSRSGSHAVVYFLQDSNTGRRLAAKVYTTDRERDPDKLDAFRDECRRWLSLPHNINWLTAYSVESVGGTVALLTEYVDGQSLRDFLQDDVLSFGGFLDIMIQVVDALQALRQHGLVHGDVKPENILVDCVGLVKIIDLGTTYELGATTRRYGTYPYNLHEWNRISADLLACMLMILEGPVGLKESLGSTITHLFKEAGNLDQRWDYVARNSLSDNKTPSAVQKLFNGLVLAVFSRTGEMDELQYYRLVVGYLKAMYEKFHAPEAVSPERINEVLRLAWAGDLTAARQSLEETLTAEEEEGGAPGNEDVARGLANEWALLGTICFKDGDLDAARVASRRSVKLDRRNGRAWLNLGGCYERGKQYEEARDAYREGLRANPRTFDLWHNLGRMYFLTGEIELGYRCVGRSLMVEPDRTEALAYIAALKESGEQYQPHIDFLNAHRNVDSQRVASVAD